MYRCHAEGQEPSKFDAILYERSNIRYLLLALSPDHS